MFELIAAQTALLEAQASYQTAWTYLIWAITAVIAWAAIMYTVITIWAVRQSAKDTSEAVKAAQERNRMGLSAAGSWVEGECDGAD